MNGWMRKEASESVSDWSGRKDGLVSQPKMPVEVSTHRKRKSDFSEGILKAWSYGDGTVGEAEAISGQKRKSPLEVIGHVIYWPGTMAETGAKEKERHLWNARRADGEGKAKFGRTTAFGIWHPTSAEGEELWKRKRGRSQI